MIRSKFKRISTILLAISLFSSSITSFADGLNNVFKTVNYTEVADLNQDLIINYKL